MQHARTSVKAVVSHEVIRVHYIYPALYFYCYYISSTSSSGIRSQRLGTSALERILKPTRRTSLVAQW